MYYRPPEWHTEKIIWLAWPYDESMWQKDLPYAQEEFIALVEALNNQPLVVIFPNEELLNKNKSLFSHKNIELKVLGYADIWLRDTFFIIVKDNNNKNVALVPSFNGWGNKYNFKADYKLSERAATLLKLPIIKTNLVFEGGALEMDGEGTLLTTEQCLLNSNRNADWTKENIEAELKKIVGAKKIIWLKEGLINDHTDGHIDTLARFIAPQKVVIMKPELDDPNYKVLNAIKEQLAREKDALGRSLTLIELPSPGAIKNADGDFMPASYVNFIIAPNKIIMPTYNAPADKKALEILSAHSSLPVIGLSARAILSGGGAFHCISQEYFL
jgi:agmatine deiminase